MYMSSVLIVLESICLSHGYVLTNISLYYIYPHNL